MNFLVTENWCIKVCDFELSRFTSTARRSTFKKLRGTTYYIAPENCAGSLEKQSEIILLGEEFTLKSDMYSLGVCLWEMVYRSINGIGITEYSNRSRNLSNAIRRMARNKLHSNCASNSQGITTNDPRNLSKGNE